MYLYKAKFSQIFRKQRLFQRPLQSKMCFSTISQHFSWWFTHQLFRMIILRRIIIQKWKHMGHHDYANTTYSYTLILSFSNCTKIHFCIKHFIFDLLYIFIILYRQELLKQCYIISYVKVTIKYIVTKLSQHSFFK